MSLYKPVIYVAIAFALATPAMAEQSTEQLTEYHDTQSNPIEVEDVERKQWSLSTEEWSRYKLLMKGVRGSISPSNISPIEVLGTHARNDQERKKYAELWAKIRFEDAARVLAFQAAYNTAFKKLYGDIPLIDISKIHPQNTAAITEDSRLLIFVKVAKCSDCERLISRTVNNPSLNKNQIDIYFVDTNPGNDDAKIRQWAVNLNIDPTRLKANQITLNHDRGNLFKITNKVINSIPIAFKMDRQSLTAIKL